MDRIFSVEEMSDHFWSSSAAASGGDDDRDNKPGSKMNRSASEWAFQQFLREEVDKKGGEDHNDEEEAKEELKNKKNGCFENNNNNTSNVPADLEDYQAFLKKKLNLACAAVALSMATSVKPQDNAARADCGSQASNAAQLGSKTVSKGAEDKDDNAVVGISSFTNGQRKLGAQVRPSTSAGSSIELSEEDEVEGENGTPENMDSADAKRVRRYLLCSVLFPPIDRYGGSGCFQIESLLGVAQLRAENANLLKRLTDISQKHNEAAVDNRVLKADVETLKAKVKMAEEAIKRTTGLNHMFHVSPEMSTMGISLFDDCPSYTSTDAAVALHDGRKHTLFPADNPISSHDQRINNSFTDISSVKNIQTNSGGSAVTGNKTGRTPSLQRVASLEHLQKRIRGGVSPCGSRSNRKQ
ncbi:hypothetical protein V6N13_014714 [Hibiscus sabdariffa]|uniref:Basic leucine-zipper C-terminal domain-containing protein n=1 Tax=Hibiscus sabdariffa TaxID=183260 RepID=A0ABR2RWZ5_9ROSI